MMTGQRITILCLLLTVVAMTGRAQTVDDKKSVNLPDSAQSDYEEWLRNEPLRPEQRDSMALQPLPPSVPVADPMKLKAKQSPVSINIMTPEQITNMKLAYQSHWLDEQRKAQQGGAMTIGVNPIALAVWVVRKLFPKHKSKKQRQREQLQQILDNY
jgi:hypothetical protein